MAVVVQDLDNLKIALTPLSSASELKSKGSPRSTCAEGIIHVANDEVLATFLVEAYRTSAFRDPSCWALAPVVS